MELLSFKDEKSSPDAYYPYSFDTHAGVPIIIDNGSYQCRVGWSTNVEPCLIFKNLIAKPRKERSKKDTVDVSQTPQLQVGNDIVNIEAVRFQLKTQFDRNVVTHYEAQEHLFDYTFSHLGIVADNCVPHPIVLTEAFLNPNSSRQLMSELLFECYRVPSVSYCIDSLLAYHFSHKNPNEDSLIIDLGYHACHVIPVLGRSTSFVNTRRLNIGGYHIITFLHRTLQLKYPAHAAAITLSRAEELLHRVCEVALDYKEELNKWIDAAYYETNIKRIQLPYSVTAVSATLEQQRERKKELARRLSEINARKREERLLEDEDRLSQLLDIKSMFETSDGDELQRVLTENQIKSYGELQKNISTLRMRIEKTKQKILVASLGEDSEEPLVKPKSSKIVFDNEVERHMFIQNAKKMRQDILNKKMVRKQRKQDMAKRRTAAGQERMRIISQLARKEKGNDDFGLRDEDWDIYKTISKDGGDSDSEAENEKLMELEDIIRTYEPAELDETSNPGETHQLHVGIESFRAPELLFKPYMAGSSEAGLSEVIGYVLSLFSPDEQLKLAANVVIVGGLANLKGLKERILADLISIRPFQSYVNVEIIANPQLSAWHGAKSWSKKPDFQKSLLTREMYEEKGAEYFVEHLTSNPFYPTPKCQSTELESNQNG